MAKKRTKFLMYTDQIDWLHNMSDEELGDAFKIVLNRINGFYDSSKNVSVNKAAGDILKQIELDTDEQQVKIVKKRKKKSIAAEPLHADVKQCFMDYYELKKKFVYAWAAKDAKSLNLFITKCRNMCISEIQTKNLAFILIKTIKDNSPWVYERLSVGLLNSMFNDIVDACKNGRRKEKTDQSFEESLDVSKQNYGEAM